jgi:sodium-dependent phosphate cotransporter
VSQWSQAAGAREDARGETAVAAARAASTGTPVSALRSLAGRVLLVVVALWLFVLALQLIKTGAGGLRPFLDSLSAGGVLGHLGLGWAGAYVVMSGSPVAAVALSLFAGGAASDAETFAMINGSRLGASLIVLVVGFAAYVRGRRNPDGLYIGVVAMLTAFTLWLPVLPLGLGIMNSGVLDGVQVHGAFGLSSAVDVITAPVMDPAKAHLQRWLLVLAGIGLLVTAFAVFDRVLPDLDRPGPRLERASRALQQKYAMFAFGSLVTLVTLSVALSVTLLVPLALKGYVRRDRVIPYVMGANVTTWVDTLLAAVLLDSPRAFTIVLTEMVAGGALSLLVLAVFCQPYTRAILWGAHRVSTSRRAMILFLGAFFAMPALLLAI